MPESGKREKTASAADSSPERGIPLGGLDPLPVDPRLFLNWLESQGIIDKSRGELVVHSERMALVDLDLALKAYKLLDSGGASARAERLLWFALCAHLPVNERRQFMDKTDAILPANYLERSLAYDGDYSLFFRYMGSAFEGPFREAIHLYCEVMSEQDLLDSLRQFGAYKISLTASEGEWEERVDQTMDKFDSVTLTLFADKISGSFLNYNKRTIKLALKRLAEKKGDAKGR